MDLIEPRFLKRTAAYTAIAFRVAPKLDDDLRLALNKLFMVSAGQEQMDEFHDFLGYVLEHWDQREDPESAIKYDLARGEFERCAAILGREKTFEAVAKVLCSDSEEKPTEPVSPSDTRAGSTE